MDDGLLAYEEGKLEEAHYKFVKCGLMGVHMCSELAFEVRVEELSDEWNVGRLGLTTVVRVVVVGGMLLSNVTLY